MTRRKLSTEDRSLWTTVAKTVNPIRPSDMSALLAEPNALVKPSLDSFRIDLSKQIGERSVSSAPLSNTLPLPLDRPTHEKIARGRLPIEARVDLHGMTQSQAYEALLYFLQRAHAENRRHVLVITGKGSSEAGILRRAVPAWIKTPAFRLYVSGIDNAARHHGGDGALYIRLRKRR